MLDLTLPNPILPSPSSALLSLNYSYATPFRSLPHPEGRGASLHYSWATPTPSPAIRRPPRHLEASRATLRAPAPPLPWGLPQPPLRAPPQWDPALRTPPPVAVAVCHHCPSPYTTKNKFNKFNVFNICAIYTNTSFSQFQHLNIKC